MVKKMLGAAMLLAGASLSAVSADAQTATITVTGNVTNGFDATGKFGAVGASLAGLPFSAIFTVEPKAGNTVINTATLSYLFGTGVTSPVTAALTIGTGTQFYAGKLHGSARANNGVSGGTINGTDGLYYSSEDTDVTTLPPPPASTLFYVSVDTLRDLLSQANYSSYPTINLLPSDNGVGFAQVANRDPVTGQYGATTYANLALSTISATVAPPVPEPATWAMMVLGFGVAGAAMRRRVRTTARVAIA